MYRLYTVFTYCFATRYRICRGSISLIAAIIYGFANGGFVTSNVVALLNVEQRNEENRMLFGLC